MLANINKIMMEKVKTFQQQIRARDERIVALETENAMLYLKLAQCQCRLRETQKEADYHKDMNDDEEKFRYTLKEKLFVAQEQVEMLKEQWKMTMKEITNMPNHFKSMLSVENLEEAGVTSMIKNLASEHKMNTKFLRLKLAQSEQARNEALRRTNEERLRRRTLHNTLIELRGNIRVHCRVRPMLSALDSNGDENVLGKPKTQSEKVVEVVDEETLVFNQINVNNSGANKTKTFEYERVYEPSDSQNAVFADVAPLLTSLLDGYNVCIMAYGQTGSGKTHTMVGDHSLDDDFPFSSEEEAKEGIVPRSAKEIFRLIKERENAQERYSLEISIFEVYNNEIIDLLATGESRNIKHAVFSASDGSQEIPSLTTKSVTSAREVIDYVIYGMQHRHEDSTKVHSHSSRSHLIVQLNIYQTNHQSSNVGTGISSPVSTRRTIQSTSIPVRSRSPASSNLRYSKSPVQSRKLGRQLTTPASKQSNDTRPPSPPSLEITPKAKIAVKTKLQLVDLAGSECVGMSGVTGSALRETSNINKSLSALADVLQALSDNHNHIPYRNTKLTHILQDTIGGDSKLLVMLCVSPVQKYTTETIQCLGFGSRTRQVARGPAKKRRPAGYSLDVPQMWSSTESLQSRSSSASLTRSASTRR